MNPNELWWQTLVDGPLLLALFDADDRLQLANAAYRAAWGLAAEAQPTAAELLDAARADGIGPVGDARVQARGRLAQRGYEQVWRDGRRFWWVEQRTADGGLACTGVDISALPGARPGVLPGQLLTAQAGLQLLQALLADSRAWPMCVATVAESEAGDLLARIRSEDACMRLDDGRLLLMLPSTGPAQAQALVERLGPLALTEARWGEAAAALILRA